MRSIVKIGNVIRQSLARQKIGRNVLSIKIIIIKVLIDMDIKFLFSITQVHFKVPFKYRYDTEKYHISNIINAKITLI